MVEHSSVRVHHLSGRLSHVFATALPVKEKSHTRGSDKRQLSGQSTGGSTIKAHRNSSEPPSPLFGVLLLLPPGFCSREGNAVRVEEVHQFAHRNLDAAFLQFCLQPSQLNGLVQEDLAAKSRLGGEVAPQGFYFVCLAGCSLRSRDVLLLFLLDQRAELH